MCTCGTPSESNYYMYVIHDLPEGGACDYSDGYYCKEHKPKPKDIIPEGHIVLEWKCTKLR